ncbi:hypothetical protein [Ahrensia sp. R2A130]|uniref:hypothetical protein n=1 Tax=Ahrensia sp. R2A130 TaxID=744979 RepID=UPI0002EE3437|nr:hypothetical protein [Ahrensia sp. R2A130]
MKNVTIFAACLALPMHAASAQAAEYGQGIQYGPTRNAVQVQFDNEQYERSHYNSTRIHYRPFFGEPKAKHYVPEAHTPKRHSRKYRRHDRKHHGH